jgi:hypothetical protein
MNKDIRFLTDIILVFLFGLLQSFSLVSFMGVKPNLLLSLLVVLLFTTKQFWQYLILILIALVSLNYSSLITRETIIFGTIMLLAFYLKGYLTEHFFLISFFLAIILTTLFYLFIDYQFIFNNINIFLLEVAFNALLTTLFGLLYHQVLFEKQR